VRVEKEGGGELRLVGVEVTANGLRKLNHLLAGGDGSSADVKPDMQRHKSKKAKTVAPSAIRAGSCVMLVGLKSETGQKLNGNRGDVMSWNAENGRWMVRVRPCAHFPIGNDFLAKPENCLLVA